LTNSDNIDTLCNTDSLIITQEGILYLNRLPDQFTISSWKASSPVFTRKAKSAPQGFRVGGIVIYKNLKNHCIVVEVGVTNEYKSSSLKEKKDFADIKLKETGTKVVFQPEKSQIQSYGENSVITLVKGTKLSLIVPFFSRVQDLVVVKDVEKPDINGIYSVFVQQVLFQGDFTPNEDESTEIRTTTLDGLVQGKSKNPKKRSSSRQDSGRSVGGGSTEGGTDDQNLMPLYNYIWYIYILHLIMTRLCIICRITFRYQTTSRSAEITSRCNTCGLQCKR